MTRALRIAILGAESTGKSRLAQALASTLDVESGLRCQRVDEYLREWCDEHGRTPRPEEQESIARAHQDRIDAACARADIDVVLCDTTPLMIAIYSDLLFGDRSLYPFARMGLEGMDVTLLMSLDLPWVADGLQRDGPHVREPVDRLVRDRLDEWNVAWSLVSGSGEARMASAIESLRPWLSRSPNTAVSGWVTSS